MSLLSLKQSLLLAVPVYLFLRTVYRLLLHPLASVPGPKWAAITSMYGAYYDLPASTTYTRQIMTLHDQYGPVVRIYPNQVHVRDMESYDEIFKPGSKFQRAQVPEYSYPVMDRSMWNELHPNTARLRRGNYLPSFSRKSIRDLEFLIQKQMLKFFSILESNVKNCPDSGIDLTMGYKCMTADVIMEYCFKKSMRFLDAPNFRAPLIMALDDWFKDLPQTWYWPKFNRFLFNAVSLLPEPILEKAMPVLAGTKWLKKQCNLRVKELLASEKSGEKESSSRSMLEKAISIKAETGEVRLGEDELTSDVYLFFAAGTDTTSNTLAFGTWNLMKNASAMQKLKAELRQSIGDVESNQLKPWQELEQLPYLESLRLSFGAVHRQPRVAPSTDYTVHGYRIPAGTVICHTTTAYHLCEEYFQNAEAFIPERWLNADSADLQHNMISFPRGPRSCVGENLAWAELYIAFAYMFRRFEFENAGTTDDDMKWTDCFVPYSIGHLNVRLRKSID